MAINNFDNGAVIPNEVTFVTDALKPWYYLTNSGTPI